MSAALSSARVAMPCVAAALSVWACTGGPAEPLPQPSLESHRPGQEQIYGTLTQHSREIADLMVEGIWDLPREKPVRLERPLTWFEDPFGEKYWRFYFYGFRPLPHLLYSYLETGDARYRDALVDFLEEFVASSPLSSEPAWQPSARFMFDKHTAAFRALVLTDVYWKLRLRGDLPNRLDGALVERIRDMGRFLAKPSSFEPGHNHGVTEANALLVVASNFSELPEASAWMSLALERVETMLMGTVDEDGAQVEQSPGYHWYVMEMFFRLSEWADSYGVELSPGVRERLEKMLRFAAVMQLPDGTLPLLGATSERYVRKAHAELIEQMGKGRPGLLYLLSGGERGEPGALARSVLFPRAGFAVLRARGDRPWAEQTQVIFDVGPYRTEHSDLDALSIFAFADGRPMLLDAGFYSLERSARRDYFHGTRGHNTVVVDGVDQRRGTAHSGPVVVDGDFSSAVGWHDLYFGVRHLRAIALVDEGVLVVVDRLWSVAKHDYQQRWHLPESASVTILDSGVVAGQGAPAVRIVQDASGDRIREFRGVSSPGRFDGWLSKSYEKAVPAPVVAFERQARDSTFYTLITFGAKATAESAIEVRGSWAGGEIDLTVGDRQHRLQMVGALILKR